MRLDPQHLGPSADVSHGASIQLVEDEQSIAEPFTNALTRRDSRATVRRSGGEATRAAPQSAGRAGTSAARSGRAPINRHIGEPRPDAA
jgi:hypothetical protein